VECSLIEKFDGDDVLVMEKNCHTRNEPSKTTESQLNQLLRKDVVADTRSGQASRMRKICSRYA
jgi:hypothetical protein